MKTYFIREDYISRLHNKYFDDTSNTDGWQKEVYEFAKKVCLENNYSKIIDIGTGSGFKLLKHFSDMDTIGIDLPQTVEWLREKYPERKWIDKFDPILGYDLVISSDVIEHIPDPDILLDLIEACKPKLIVLSTPDRDLVKPGKNGILGPPKNRAHVREWSMTEFYNYINSRFDVLDHFISNKKQGTQTLLARLKN